MKNLFARIPLSNKHRQWQLFAVQCAIVAIVLIFMMLYAPEKLIYITKRKLAVKAEMNSAEKALQWMNMPDKMQYLNENPVYAQFDIPRQQNYHKYDLLIIVSSAPKRHKRRMAIRETWWQQCISTKRVTIKCVFMTDLSKESAQSDQKLIGEQQQYQDIEFQKLEGGVEFGKRYLYHLVWAVQSFDFNYFLRMDDDYFFCLDRFMTELPLPPPKLYHWGYVHCFSQIVRPEESIILFSRDLVEMFLAQNPLKIASHPWADQMIAIWVKELELPKIYNHDPRLHHTPTLLHIKNITGIFEDVCNNFIGVHGSYPNHMKTLWKLRKSKQYSNVLLNEYTSQCYFPQVFNWESFSPYWRYKPKKFITNPVWNTTKQDSGTKVFGGREEGKGD